MKLAQFARTCPRLRCQGGGSSQGASAMPDTPAQHSLLAAVEAYFETMFDADLERFDRLFAPTATPAWPARWCLARPARRRLSKPAGVNPSPKAKNAPATTGDLDAGFASPEQALVKVRVRIDQVLYVDYLSFHRRRRRLAPDGQVLPHRTTLCLRARRAIPSPSRSWRP